VSRIIRAPNLSFLKGLPGATRFLFSEQPRNIRDTNEYLQNSALGLDDMDELFNNPEIAQGFFGLLRAWHEQARNDPLWKKLRVVVVYSTEVYIPLNINQSPFNVELPIKLPEFNRGQVQDLVQRHGLNWSAAQVQDLMKMVGGHPYLVRAALYQIAQKKMALEHLVQVAAIEEDLYGDDLRRHLLNLEEYDDLLQAMRQVVVADKPVEMDRSVAFKLRSMGLVKFQENAVVPACELYHQYFRERLVLF
jgi:AAA-like domain